MRVGILDILALPSQRPVDSVYHFLLTKQWASLTPQAISVWCRRMGHETFYRPYYGVGDPGRQLPADLDLVFISCYTQASALGYALAKKYRSEGIRTVIGGPHARSFPVDCLRFFDLVVKECDQNLIADILAGRFRPSSIISSARPFEEVPLVEERMPELRASAFLFGRWRYRSTTIPLLASVGCPYSCDFCVDWDNPYRQLSLDRLATDLRYLSTHLRGTLFGFHDPNFAVKFDQVLDVLESIPPEARSPYVMESSLSVLRGSRAERLRATRCVLAAPGIESWMDYSRKAGVGHRTGREKVDRLVEQFEHLHENVACLQANFMFGLDCDAGEEPVELTKEFISRAPFVWPTINIPVPFAGTPLYEQYAASGRILWSMPFSFYYAPYLVTTLKNYDPVTFYQKLIDLLEHATSPEILRRRLGGSESRAVKVVQWVRTASLRAAIKGYRQILDMLRTDSQFRAYHEGLTDVLPEFYHEQYERMLGRYAALMTRQDRIPVLTGQGGGG